jgi:hypothetical protein
VLPKVAFLQVDFDPRLDQLLEQVVMMFNVLIMSGGVQKEVIDADEDIAEAVTHLILGSVRRLAILGPIGIESFELFIIELRFSREFFGNGGNH